MDPIFPFVTVLLAAAAALVVRRARPRLSDDRRTFWTLHLGFCKNPSRSHRYDSCTMMQDFREGRTECAKCGHGIHLADPLSQSQVDGNGEGLKLDPNGPLISSLCEGEWEPKPSGHPSYESLPKGDRHMPLFDLDYPVELDGRTLILHTRVSIPRARSVIAWMESQDLSPFGATEAFLRAHAPEGAEGAYRTSEWVPRLEIRLSVPAELVPSRTPGHYHLYLQAVVTWEQYVELMRRMADAELIEQGWFRMSLRRRMAMLRKSDVRKA